MCVWGGGHLSGGVQDWGFQRRDVCRPAAYLMPKGNSVFPSLKWGLALSLVGKEGMAWGFPYHN